MPYMMPNPNRLSVTVNGRTYTSSVNAAIVVDPVDVPVLEANGWTKADPIQDVELDAFVALVGDVSLLQTQVAALELENTTQVLTADANGAIGWNASGGHKASVTISANSSMNAPQNVSNGRYVLTMTQNAASNWPITFNSAYKLAGGAFTLTATNGATDVLEFEYNGTAFLEISRSQDVK